MVIGMGIWVWMMVRTKRLLSWLVLVLSSIIPVANIAIATAARIVTILITPITVVGSLSLFIPMRLIPVRERISSLPSLIWIH